MWFEGSEAGGAGPSAGKWSVCREVELFEEMEEKSAASGNLLRGMGLSRFREAGRRGRRVGRVIDFGGRENYNFKLLIWKGGNERGSAKVPRCEGD